MITNKIIQQFGLAKPASISRRYVFVPLIGIFAAIFTLGTLAQDPNAFRQNVGLKLQPGDIVYVDSGDAIHGGFVIKVNPVTGEKTVIASGGLLRMPFGVVIDANGQIIVSDSGRLIRIDPETGAQNLIADNSQGDLGWPCGLAMQHHNSIVVANLQAVIKVNPNSSQIQTVCAGGSLLYPLCVASTEGEDLIVLNMAFPPEIIRVSPNGAQMVIARGGLLNRPQALAVRSDHIYVTDVAAADGSFGIGRVIGVDARTGEETIVEEAGFLCGPVGIAVDEEGQLIVGDPYTINLDSPDRFDGGIIRINPTTQEQTLIARGEGSFVNPAVLRLFPARLPTEQVKSASEKILGGKKLGTNRRFEQHPSAGLPALRQRMSKESFPSGPWLGFYNYNFGRREKHRMDLILTFANGSMTGEGSDDVGRFLVKGRYDSGNGECYWTKSYIGAHDVFYRGFRDGKGIWGIWEIGPRWRGGFHIWPRQAGEWEQATASAEAEAPVDAIATEAGVVCGKPWEAVETANASPNLRTPG